MSLTIRYRPSALPPIAVFNYSIIIVMLAESCDTNEVEAYRAGPELGIRSELECFLSIVSILAVI